MKYVWIAELDTRKYSFTGFGKTEEEAKQAIFNEWLSHGWNNYCYTNFSTLAELEKHYDISTYKAIIGTCEVR